MQKTILMLTTAAMLMASTAFAQELPVSADVKAAGELVIANSLSYAPFEFRDDAGNAAGLNIELANAVAKALGTELRIEVIPFTSSIPALTSGRVKVAWATFSVTKERLQQVDFVGFMRSGTVAVTHPEKRDQFPDALSLCGVDVAVTGGSTSDLLVDRINAECSKAEREPIEKVVYPDIREVIQAVISNRNPVYLDASTTAAYFELTTKGQLVVATKEPFYPTPVGLAVKDGDAETAEMLRAAIQKLMDDGTYGEIYDRYNMKASTINEVALYADPDAVEL